MVIKRILLSLGLAVFYLATAFYTVYAQEAKTIDNQKYIIYIPSNIDYSKKHALVAAFSPSANAQSMIEVWKSVSEEYKWIIFSSKEFRNGSVATVLPNLASSVKQLCLQLPIDSSKIIASGFSGGGMFSYLFAFEYPELITAVVSNCGRMHQDMLDQNRYSPVKGKLAVFLASPTDFNYNDMKENQKYLETIGWKTKWLEFIEGHTIAPENTYQEAAEWLNEQLQ